MLPAIGFHSCPDRSERPLISLTVEILSSSGYTLSCEVSKLSVCESVWKDSDSGLLEKFSERSLASRRGDGCCDGVGKDSNVDAS